MSEDEAKQLGAELGAQVFAVCIGVHAWRQALIGIVQAFLGKGPK